MYNSILLLLIIVPGFIARKIYKQTNDIRENLSQLDEILYCLLNSLVIFTLLFLTDNELVIKLKKFNEFFYLKYFISSLITAAIIGFITDKFRKIYTSCVNKIRSAKNLDNILISKTVFDEVFNPKNFVMEDCTQIAPLVSIYKEDKYITTGILEMRSEQFKEFYIVNADEMISDIVETFKKMPPYKGVYFDGKTGLIIKIYDLSKLGE